MTQTQNINTSIVKDFKNRVNTICAQRSTWQLTQFKSANDALYNMLGEIYALTKHYTNTTKADEIKYDWLLNECTKKGIKLSKKPSFVQLLVKYVFTDNDTDSRRISSYVRVLNAALQSSEVTSATDVSLFIHKYGGVEEIRASLTKGTKTPLQRAASGREIILKGNTIVTVNTDDTLKHVSTAKGKIVLLVGILNAKGSVDVKHVCYELAPSDKHLSAKSSVNAALSNVYSTTQLALKKTNKQMKEEKEIEDKNQQALNIANQANTSNQNVNQAA
jgi:hypothetical protein